MVLWYFDLERLIIIIIVNTNQVCATDIHIIFHIESILVNLSVALSPDPVKTETIKSS